MQLGNKQMDPTNAFVKKSVKVEKGSGQCHKFRKNSKTTALFKAKTGRIFGKN